MGPLQERHVARAFGKIIGIGEEQALGGGLGVTQRRPQGRQRVSAERVADQRRLADGIQHSVQIPAFDQGEGVLNHLPVYEQVQQFNRGQAGPDLIFTGLDLPGPA